MTLVTLFKMYEKAVSSKEMYYGQYGRRWGIAVNEDHIAQRWQRCDRIARKLRTRILEKMGYPGPQPTCVHCGWWKSACQCAAFEPHLPLKPVVV